MQASIALCVDELSIRPFQRIYRVRFCAHPTELREVPQRVYSKIPHITVVPATPQRWQRIRLNASTSGGVSPSLPPPFVVRLFASPLNHRVEVHWYEQNDTYLLCCLAQVFGIEWDEGTPEYTVFNEWNASDWAQRMEMVTFDGVKRIRKCD